MLSSSPKICEGTVVEKSSTDDSYTETIEHTGFRAHQPRDLPLCACGASEGYALSTHGILSSRPAQPGSASYVTAHLHPYKRATRSSFPKDWICQGGNQGGSLKGDPLNL